MERRLCRSVDTLPLRKASENEPSAFLQGGGLGLYPSAQAVRERRDNWLVYLQRPFGMQRETALASFPLDTVLSTRLVTWQPGAPSCLADPSSSFPCSCFADYLIHAKVEQSLGRLWVPPRWLLCCSRSGPDV